MYTKLLTTVTNLGSPRVVLVGDFMLDSYVYGDALRISPEAPVPVLKVVKREHAPGGAGSVAADLVALGAKSLCIGIIGNDVNGQILTDMLKKSGVDTSNFITLAHRPTTSKQRLVGLAQHRHRQQLMRIDEEITDALAESEYDKIFAVYKELLTKSDIVCLQDYNKGMLEWAFCQKLIKTAKQAGKKVLIDPSPITDYSRYQGATVITPNRKEAGLATGMKIETIEDAAKAADMLAEKFNIEAVVITLDKEGAYLRTKSISKLMPTVARSVYDVTGAGDVVLATLATAISASCDYETAVELANIAGGIEVEKFGVATVSIDEMVNEIINRNRSNAGKIRDIDSLVTQLKYHRMQGHKIVFTNGCFDVIHRGHIEYLSFCKTQGDIVVLGLNSDESVRRNKGPTRPINNQHDRGAVLAALECIDYITIFDDDTPLGLIMKVKPDVLVKGEDWAVKGVVGREFVEANGGKVVLAKLVEGKSSTATIAKMKAAKEQEK